MRVSEMRAVGAAAGGESERSRSVIVVAAGSADGPTAVRRLLPSRRRHRRPRRRPTRRSRRAAPSCRRATRTAACSPGAPDYQADVERAIRTLQGEQPALFEGDQVLSTGAYYVGVIRILDRQGLCAAIDGEELGVTEGASSNEQYDILSSKNRARFGPNSYRTTCRPVRRADPAGRPAPSPAGCPLPPSREIACGREPQGQLHRGRRSGHRADPGGQAGAVRLQRPGPGDGLAGSEEPRRAITRAVVDILVKKGYCAKDDGEEIGVKKGSNTFSEQYDVNYQDKYIRTGSGIYRASCYPAGILAGARGALSPP